MSAGARLRLHARLADSRANGPGRRAVIWVQGCSLGCPGCYNPETHDGVAGDETAVDELLEWLASLGDSVEGVSISGGEPLEQAGGLLALVRGVRDRMPSMSVLVFSGFRKSEIEARAHGPEILASIDVLIDGRYVRTQHVGRELLGSKNQHIHCLTDRYQLEDVTATPATEVTIGADGSVVLTGVSPLDLDLDS